MTGTTQSPAGLWTRVLAFAFDYLAIAGYLVLLVLGGVGLRSLSPNLADTLFGSPWIGQLTSFLVLTLPVTLYFALMESSPRQGTWGKQRRSLRVIRRSGERLTFIHTLGRTLLKFVPWELAHTCIWQVSHAGEDVPPVITVGFVVVWVLVGANIVSLMVSPERQTLYERLSGTCVVREPAS